MLECSFQLSHIGQGPKNQSKLFLAKARKEGGGKRELTAGISRWEVPGLWPVQHRIHGALKNSLAPLASPTFKQGQALGVGHAGMGPAVQVFDQIFTVAHRGVFSCCQQRREAASAPQHRGRWRRGEGAASWQQECILWSFKLSDITWPFSTLFNYGIFRLMGKKKGVRRIQFFCCFLFLIRFSTSHWTGAAKDQQHWQFINPQARGWEQQIIVFRAGISQMEFFLSTKLAPLSTRTIKIGCLQICRVPWAQAAAGDTRQPQPHCSSISEKILSRNLC